MAVLLLSLAFGPATPSAPDAPASAAVIQFPSEKDRWIQVQTAHFTLFSNASEKESREIGVRFERMRSALSTIGDRTEVNSPTPTWIYVFKDEASFRPYQPQAGGSSGGAAGYLSVRRDGNYAALSVTSGLDAFLPIFHELTHDFLRTNLPDLPAWLDEGIAACYATFRADDKAVEIGRPYPDRLLWLRNRTPIPMQQLFTIGPDSKEIASGEARHLFEVQSWAFVHYLLWERPQGRQQFTQILERLRQGGDPVDAVMTTLKTDPRKLEGELRSFIGQGRIVFTDVKADRIEIDATTTIKPLMREELLFRLGDLILHTGIQQTAGAEAHFREALRLNPSHAPAHAGLGLAAFRAARYEEATPLFEKAVELDPNDFLINFRFGRSLLDQIDAQEGSPEAPNSAATQMLLRARDLFGRSIEERPSFAEAYVGFGETFLKTPEGAGAAISVLERARRMLPSRPDIAADLVILYARKGDLAKARELVDTVLAKSHNAAALKAARDELAKHDGSQTIPIGPSPTGQVGGGSTSATPAPPP